MSALGENGASAFRVKYRKNSEIFALGLDHLRLSEGSSRKEQSEYLSKQTRGIISLYRKWLKEWKTVSDRQPIAVVCTD